MTFLHHNVPSSFDKNAFSLQHIDAFSIGREEHRSHKRSKDVFDGDQHFQIEPPSSSSCCYGVLSCRSSLEEYSRFRWYGNICDMFTKISRIHRAKIAASNHDTSSMPTVHCALFKMAAAGISKRLKGSSLKIEKKISSLGEAFF